MRIIKKLSSNDIHKYSIHLKSLSNESKVLRFTSIVNDFIIDEFCNNIQKQINQHILFVIENNKLEFIAVGHLVVLNNSVEIAVSVLDEYQHQGMGSALIKRMLQYCSVFGYLNGEMTCLPQNYIIKKICIDNGIKIKSRYNEVIGTFKLEHANKCTRLIEYLNYYLGYFNFVVKRFIFTFA